MDLSNKNMIFQILTLVFPLSFLYHSSIFPLSFFYLSSIFPLSFLYLSSIFLFLPFLYLLTLLAFYFTIFHISNFSCFYLFTLFSLYFFDYIYMALSQLFIDCCFYILFPTIESSFWSSSFSPFRLCSSSIIIPILLFSTFFPFPFLLFSTFFIYMCICMCENLLLCVCVCVCEGLGVGDSYVVVLRRPIITGTINGWPGLRWRVRIGIIPYQWGSIRDLVIANCKLTIQADGAYSCATPGRRKIFPLIVPRCDCMGM